MIEAVAETRVTPTRSPVAAMLGLLSVTLLGASFVWAHHWGVRTDTLVAFRLTQIGLAGGVISLVALALAGIAYAAGINPTGACGGG